MDLRRAVADWLKEADAVGYEQGRADAAKELSQRSDKGVARRYLEARLRNAEDTASFQRNMIESLKESISESEKAILRSELEVAVLKALKEEMAGEGK